MSWVKIALIGTAGNDPLMREIYEVDTPPPTRTAADIHPGHAAFWKHRTRVTVEHIIRQFQDVKSNMATCKVLGKFLAEVQYVTWLIESTLIKGHLSLENVNGSWVSVCRCLDTVYFICHRNTASGQFVTCRTYWPYWECWRIAFIDESTETKPINWRYEISCKNSQKVQLFFRIWVKFLNLVCRVRLGAKTLLRDLFLTHACSLSEISS